MQTSTRGRFRYHPDPEQAIAADAEHSSFRRVAARKDMILRQVNLQGKSILDLGCSGGYFGFSLSSVLGSYLGIDGDRELIARNNSVAERAGLKHLRFEYNSISPEQIRQLPRFDVALFLSVFHHILAVSKAYDWNQKNDWEPMEILTALAERVDVLVFETGYPDEGMEWCKNLPPMLPSPQAWVTDALRAAGFERVEMIAAPDKQGFNGRLRGWLWKHLIGRMDKSTIAARIIRRVFRIDPRDARDVFVARRS